MSSCKSCGKKIVFLKTIAGKTMPVNYETWDGNLTFNPAKHTAHFATCPHAAVFRKPKPNKKKEIFI